jgi:hypothetical protein
MNSLVGFSAILGLTEGNLKAALAAQRRALDYFPHLHHLSIQAGESRLELWGHNELSDCVRLLPDGGVLALIGSPLGDVSWPKVEESLAQAGRPEDFELPWDGRVILLKISADGQQWTMWNDWLGSIPVFRTPIGQGRIASTLEPVVVAAAGFTPDDFFMPGLVSLLINGHFLADWTLFSGMKTVPPDCMAKWDDRGFHWSQLWTVKPSDERWEAGWDDLVDEMYELTRQAIVDVLKTQPTWIVPLSSGLDSRLIAAVGADVGADIYTYAWGEPETTDVVFSRQIAKALDLPWKHIDLPNDFLVNYTRHWADWFGSAMHFHGMYQMCFLDALELEPAGRVLTGFIGDALAGDSLNELVMVHSHPGSYQLEDEWYVHWTAKELESLMKIPINDALEANAHELNSQIDRLPGAWFQRLQFLELWGRQRFFTYFQSVVSDYWRAVAAPFINRAYGRFSMSLPRTALDDRRLLRDVYRRHYGLLATIPGTYAQDPFIPTGRYLLKRRISSALPRPLRRGPLRGYDFVPLRMDVDCVQATGKASLWPIYDVWDQLEQWLDVGQLDLAYQKLMKSTEDIRPLRQLQSVQALAYRLLDTHNGLCGDHQ